MSDTGEYSLEAVRAERERRARAARLQAGASGQSITIEDIRRERARRVSAQRAAQPPRRGQPASLVQEIEGGLAAFNRGIPVSNDISSAGAGLLEMARGGSFNEGFQRQRQRTLDVANDFTARRPNVSNFTTGAGMALPLALTAGAAAPEIAASQTAARGFPLLAQQSAQAGTVGALAGAVYGAGAPDQAGQPWQDRLNAANEGAAFGGALGLATPAASNVVRGVLSPASRAIEGAFNRIPVPEPNSVGAMGRPMRPAQPRPPAPPPVSPATVGTIERLRDRSMQTTDQLERAVASESANPQGRVVADLFGDPGVRTLRSIAQGPGQTGTRAAETAHARALAQPDRILNEFNRRLGVAETPEQALESLSAQYDSVSANAFRPLWERPIDPGAQAEFMRRVQPLIDDPVMTRASERARRIFERDVRLGLVEGSFEQNLPRFLHYMKMGVDEEARWAANPMNGIGATELRGIRELQRRFVSTLDQAIPGYSEARSQWGGLIEAQDALEAGQRMISESHGSIMQHMQRMTPFARYHARVGFANAVAQKIGLRGSVNGNRNVAEALGSPEMQRRVRAMFESPEEAAAFLDTLNQQNMLMRNAGQWGTGSPTYSNAMHGADEALNAIADIGMQTASGNLAGAARRTAQGALNTVTMGAIERRNNQVGADLLRPVASDREFVDRVIQILRQREVERAGASRLAPATGAAAGEAQQTRKRR